MNKLSEDIQRLLKTVVDECDREDRSVRERQLRQARRLKLFWEGFSRVWYSEVAHDWRIWDEVQDQNQDQGSYDKPINVFRAYLESIIAALSVTVPPIKCYPDDADNSLDLETARAGDKIAQLIYRHNDVPLLWIHSLFIFCTEGMVAAYSRPECDKKYGTYEQNNYEDEEETHNITTCPNCGSTIDDQIAEQTEEAVNNEKDEFNPDDEDTPVSDEIKQGELDGTTECPNCMQQVIAHTQQEKFVVPRLVGKTELPKSRICIDSYGLLNVKVSNYAKNQAQCAYLTFCEEVNYALAMQEVIDYTGDFDLAKKITAENAPGAYDYYDQWARLSPQYQGTYPENVITRKKVWLRPAMFNVLKDKDDINKLKKKYPNGAHVCMYGDYVAWAENQCLDDMWTLTYNPLSDYIHFDPLGLLLVSIQEITNDLTSLTLQTIEHGVPITYADPGVLNFTAYEQTEVVPGGVFPATPKTGKSLGDGFYEAKTTTLSAEVMPFSANIQSMGQLVSGALPSLFGGNLGPGASETASQYSMSRAQALQRLQNNWKMFTLWWKQIFGKVIPLAMKEFKSDENDVQRDTNGNFINTFIRMAELSGKIGKVELEANENLPITWSQQKDVWEKLLQNANPEIIAILSAPENLPILREAIGLDDLFVPGEDDRMKQYDEIKLLLQSQPVTDPMDGNEYPSVEIDPDYDNHKVEFEICRKWVVSESGRLAKTDNPVGYKNVLLHGRAHLHMIQVLSQPMPIPVQPKISYTFSGQDLMDPQVRQEFDKAAQLAGLPDNSNSQNSQGVNGAAPVEKPTLPNLQEAPVVGDGNVNQVH